MGDEEKEGGRDIYTLDPGLRRDDNLPYYCLFITHKIYFLSEMRVSGAKVDIPFFICHKKNRPYTD